MICTSSNLLSLLGAQNKDLGAASQVLDCICDTGYVGCW